MRQKMVDDIHRILLATSEWPGEVRLPLRTLTARPLLGPPIQMSSAGEDLSNEVRGWTCFGKSLPPPTSVVKGEQRCCK